MEKQNEKPRGEKRETREISQRDEADEEVAEDKRNRKETGKVTAEDAGEDTDDTEEDTSEVTQEDMFADIYEQLYKNYLAAYERGDITTLYEPTGAFMVSAHGTEAEVDTTGKIITKPIIEQIKEDYKHYYDNMLWTHGENWSDAITNLIDNTNIGAAVGLGTLSLMMQCTKDQCSSSQADIKLVNDMYKGFYTKYHDIPPNSYIENRLFTISRLNLREQVREYSDPVRNIEKSAWAQHFFNNVDEGKTWRHIKVRPEINKTYSLHANEGEAPSYDCNYGLHIISLIMQNKKENKYYRVFPDQTISSNIDVDATRQHLDAYVDALYPPDDTTQNSRIGREAYDAVMIRINNSVNGDDDIYTSDLIMLGVILQLEEMFIFDPSCRPVERVGFKPIVLRPGRDGKARAVDRDLVTTLDDENEETQDFLGPPSPTRGARVNQPPFPGYASAATAAQESEEDDQKKNEEKKGFFSWLFKGGRGRGNQFTKHRRRNKIPRRTTKKKHIRRAKRKTNRPKRKYKYRYTKRKHNNNKISTR